MLLKYTDDDDDDINPCRTETHAVELCANDILGKPTNVRISLTLEGGSASDHWRCQAVSVKRSDRVYRFRCDAYVTTGHTSTCDRK